MIVAPVVITPAVLAIAATYLRLPGRRSRRSHRLPLRALTQIVQAVAGNVIGNAVTVIDDIDEQLVFDRDGDGKCGGVGMARGVADCFAHTASA